MAFPVSLALVLALAGCESGSGNQQQPGDTRSNPALPVEIIEVRTRDLSRVVRISGTVEPLRTIRLASRTEGILTEVLVEEGDAVAPDQVLARIDVREQQAELDRARANLREKRANFQRLERLRDRDYVDDATFESARAELDVAASEVRLWETRVEFGTVTAGIHATVVSREVEPGEAVSRHAPLFSLADLSSMVVRLGVSELDVPGLEVGDTVLLEIDAVDGDGPMAGLIRRVFPAAEADSRLITVEVEIPGAVQAGIRPGYLVRAELITDRRPDTLAVPAGSMAESADGHFVMVVDSEDRLQRRSVTPGILRGPWREITNGLSPGERVVAANPREMSPGERVRVVGRLEG